MAHKRRIDTKKIQYFQQVQLQKEKETEIMMKGLKKQANPVENSNDEEEDDGYVVEKNMESLTTRKKSKNVAKADAVLKETGAFRDEDFYIQRYAKDLLTEHGLSINTFTKDARSAEISLAPDSNEGRQLEQKLKRWDRKKKKMVSVEDKRVGKILTEHGTWIPASYKTNRYEKWKDKTKIDEQLEREQDSDDQTPVKTFCEC
jgi:ATP-dependent RNA helicase DDX54/DBP10